MSPYDREKLRGFGPQLRPAHVRMVRDIVNCAQRQGKKVLFDYFCGVGGAARGYQLAGFVVVGFDTRPQPNYAGDLFIRANAFQAAWMLGHMADASHGSPPCQRYTTLASGTNGNRDELPDLVDPFRRDMLRLWHMFEKPFVIENVPNAPLQRDKVIRLCGEMFRDEGLKVLRHRDFECHGFEIEQPPHIPHKGKSRGWNHGVYTPASEARYVPVYGNGGGNADRGDVSVWQDAMQMPWAQTKDELREAIPPPYTFYVGTGLFDSV